MRFYWYSKEGTKIYDGPDFLLLQLFQHCSNRRLLFKREKFLSRVIENIRNKSADVSFNALYFTRDNHAFADYTASLLQQPYCVVVRQAPAPSFGASLLRPYQREAWAAMGVTLLVMAAAWRVAQRWRRPAESLPPKASVHDGVGVIECDSTWGRAVLDAVQTSLTGICSRPARTSAQRLVLAAMLLFATVLGHAYSGQLLGCLAATSRPTDPLSLAEASRLLRSVYISSSLRDVFEHYDQAGILRDLIGKLKIKSSDDKNERINSIATQGLDGYFMTEQRYEAVARSKNLTTGGARALYRVPECVHCPGHLAFVVPKGSPSRESLNSFVLRVLQAGLYAQWTRAQRHRMEANGLTVPGTASPKQTKALALAQLAWPLALLQAGVYGAGAACLFELLLERCRRRCRQC
ncbi:hypothetical protein R5R35_010086 [Gryllus longicercus]|uniref:Ionotropic receptor n=1 Tax=Gryllus longicercus TaxID=2509291 RepID=A0AAN9Z7D5_9ORTH